MLDVIEHTGDKQICRTEGTSPHLYSVSDTFANSRPHEAQ